MESKNTFHLKKKPSVQALQYVNGKKSGSLFRKTPGDEFLLSFASERIQG